MKKQGALFVDIDPSVASGNTYSPLRHNHYVNKKINQEVAALNDDGKRVLNVSLTLSHCSDGYSIKYIHICLLWEEE